MARTPVAPVPLPEVPPTEVVLDYELALTTAQQFVRFFQGAQQLQRLVVLLTEREQIIQELDRRRLLAEGQLRQVDEQIAAAQHIYTTEQDKLLAQSAEHTARQAHMAQEQEIMQAQLTAMAAAREQQEKDMAREEANAQRRLTAARHRIQAETETLLATRQAQLAETEAQHLAQLERLQAQSEAEAQRSAQIKDEIAAIRQRLLANVAGEEEGAS